MEFHVRSSADRDENPVTVMAMTGAVRIRFPGKKNMGHLGYGRRSCLVC